MQEQTRAKNSKQAGEKHIKQRKWPTITSTAKAARAEVTSGKNKKSIDKEKQIVARELQAIYIPEVIIPKFNLSARVSGGGKTVINISNGGCAYAGTTILTNINLILNQADKVVIHGANASGKSTLIKAILNDAMVSKSGRWECPNPRDIGYLDQHYSQLNPDKTAVELIKELVPNWTHAEVRDHLNSFLLRKNEEVNIPSKYLSGGEKVRLSLALIAAQIPRLLLLDEITNNIDLETKEHVIQVLKDYPGAFILICHDMKFIEKLHIDMHYQIEDGVFHVIPAYTRVWEAGISI
jgi:ATPase subunit of ABC transporter with duplicated ATPase domains